jgi:hypothetical protein
MDQLEPINNLTLSRHEVFDMLRWDTFKVTTRELSYWTDFKIVIPDIANPSSQGKTRFYSLLNVVDFAVVNFKAAAKKQDGCGVNAPGWGPLSLSGLCLQVFLLGPFQELL